MGVLPHLTEFEKPIDELASLRMHDECPDGIINISFLTLRDLGEAAVSSSFGVFTVHSCTIPEILRDCKEPYPILP